MKDCKSYSVAPPLADIAFRNFWNLDMALDVNTRIETIELLSREADCLKHKLEEERKKLNDVTCMCLAIKIILSTLSIYSIYY